ncbi:hypothetical protein PR048_011624 [Dryococelus australis]|uniref:Uncharacterized protein n=1 Tax=Dryococelus australis TaxID=614101 RepID=A0ABQ9HME5_9NEOP|nr:hypothetical protein PR048_011624 [Dryococelus australis]
MENDGQSHCSINDVLKLIPESFNGDKRILREFVDNVEVAFELADPVDHEKLLKFVKTKITGDAKCKILVRMATDSWEEGREILEDNYATKRALHFYAYYMFNARQGKTEAIASWSSRIDTIQIDFKEAASRVFCSL